MAYSPEPGSSPAAPRGAACIANISPRERLKRLVGGVIPFVIAVAILAGLLGIHAARWWRVPLFLLLFVAAIGFFQWRDKT